MGPIIGDPKSDAGFFPLFLRVLEGFEFVLRPCVPWSNKYVYFVRYLFMVPWRLDHGLGHGQNIGLFILHMVLFLS